MFPTALSLERVFLLRRSGLRGDGQQEVAVVERKYYLQRVVRLISFHPRKWAPAAPIHDAILHFSPTSLNREVHQLALALASCVSHHKYHN